MKILLFIVCLLIMTAFIYFEKKEKFVIAVILKGLASFAFVMLGFWCSRVVTGSEGFVKFVRIGLILGLVADILLNLRFVFKEKGKLVFLLGILVFLAGHILYLCALIPTVGNIIIPLIIGIIVTFVVIKWIFTMIEAQKAFKIFGIFYIGTIVIMNCFAIANLVQDPTNTRYIIFAIGALLFFISDVVLILNTFGKQTRFILRITNLSLYYLGQLLIALSLLFPIMVIA